MHDDDHIDDDRMGRSSAIGRTHRRVSGDEQLDWSFIAYALSDAGLGMHERWRSIEDRAGDGKRAGRYGKLLKRLGRDLEALAEIMADDDFASQSRKADRALADAVAGPLVGLGEDLRAATPRSDREPAHDD